MAGKPIPPIDRLARLVDMTGGPDACWPFTGFVNRYGYGIFTLNNRPKRAHRVMWETVVDPVDPLLHLDHLCRNRACCNPEHLEPVTAAVNILRGEGASAINARRTECAHGHPFDEANTGFRPSGSRYCRQCAAISMARRREAFYEDGLTSRGVVPQREHRDLVGNGHLARLDARTR